MRTVTSADGTQIAYDIHNPDGAGTPLVMTHGYSATSAMWQPNVDALSADRPVLVYDQRGHGRSGAPPTVAGYSEELSVGDLDVLIGLLGVPRVNVLGMSLGGYLSLAYHLRHPKRVASLVLQDTGPGYKSDAARDAWNQHVDTLAERTREPGYNAGLSAERAIAVHEHPEALLLVAQGTLKQQDDRVIRSLPDIAVPTLVIVGDQDEPYIAGSHYMTEKIPGARLEIIADAGHAANIDQPDRFNDAVGTFLRSLDA